MSCQNCGADHESGTFCGKCGARLVVSSSSESSTQRAGFPTYDSPKKSGRAAFGWILSILIACGLAFFFFTNAQGKSSTSSGSVSQSQDQAIADAQAKQAAADAAAAQAAADAAAAQAQLPGASTVGEAVAVALYSYCPNSNESQWNTANWTMSSSPTNPPIEGYWELYAPTSGGGYVYLHVTPNGDGSIVTVTAANDYGHQAFDHWGCPASMDVAVYAADTN